MILLEIAGTLLLGSCGCGLTLWGKLRAVEPYQGEHEKDAGDKDSCASASAHCVTAHNSQYVVFDFLRRVFTCFFVRRIYPARMHHRRQ